MHLPLAHLVSMSVIFCLLPSSCIVRLHHYNEDIVFVSIIIITFFFANEVYRTNMTHIQVWTPSEPKFTDPLSASLTHFSRSQTHF